MVGYDTFNSILKQDRDEAKDPADYYNVTVSMMIKRDELAAKQTPACDGHCNTTLISQLDKGFPYDDSNLHVETNEANMKALKQMSVKDVVGKLEGANITKESLINLVKDKQSPIVDTKVAAAQQKSEKNVKLAQTEGSPILVQPVLLQNTMKNFNFGENIVVGVDDASYAQTHDKMNLLAQTSNPVVNPPFNNWSVNQPSPPHQYGMTGTEDLGQRNIIIDGVNYDYVQTKADVKMQNPVVNPPFNNWSVNEPSPPHQHGLNGAADLGQNIIVDGHSIHFAQKDEKKTNLAQLIPMSDDQNQPGNFALIDRNVNNSAIDLAQTASSLK